MSDIDPSSTSAAYQRQSPDWLLLRTVLEGTTAMRSAGKTFLPQYPGEDDANYKARLQRAVLTNFLEDALRNAAGLPFRAPLNVETTDADIKAFCDDVDLRGNSLHVFASKVFEEACAMGMTYIWVDYPVAQPGETRKDQKGRRPYFILKPVETVLACYATFVGGVQYITEVRFTDDIVQVVNFKEIEVERVRVFRHDPTQGGNPTWELWQKSEGATGGSTEWVMADAGTLTLPFIPMVPVYAGRIRTDFDVKPLFLDLAAKNVEHYQSTSDQRNILTVSRFPMLAVSGAKLNQSTSEKATIGPNTILECENPQGHWYYVESTGNAAGMGFTDIEKLEGQMKTMGLQPIATRDSGTVTATERALDEAKAQTAIQKAANNLEDALNQALWVVGAWMGKDIQADVMLNEDYGITSGETQEADVLLKMQQAAVISKETLYEELQRRNFLSPTFDADAEAAKIENDGPTAAENAAVDAAAAKAATRTGGNGTISGVAGNA